MKTPSGEDGATDLKKAAEDLPVVKIVDTLLKHAILEGGERHPYRAGGERRGDALPHRRSGSMTL